MYKTDIVKARSLNVGDRLTTEVQVLEKSYDSVDGKFILVLGTDGSTLEDVNTFSIIVVKVDDKFEIVK